MSARVRLAGWAPLVFVLLWSTGFIVARYGMPHAPPLGFLSLRLALSALVLGPVILWVRAPWPRGSDLRVLAGIGLLVHGGYLAGVWCAVKLGMSAGVVALIVNLQPLLTALIGRWYGERLGTRAWTGLLLGFAGVALVVQRSVHTEGLEPVTVLLAFLALLSISFGSAWQKRRIPSFDLRTGAFVQYAACVLALAPLALMLENEPIRWEAELIGALAWSVLALSIVAVFMMYRLIEEGEATRVASLFYLVPPSTALLAWILFDERFGTLAWVGIALAAVGVALVRAPVSPRWHHRGRATRPDTDRSAAP